MATFMKPRSREGSHGADTPPQQKVSGLGSELGGHTPEQEPHPNMLGRSLPSCSGQKPRSSPLSKSESISHSVVSDSL